MLKISLENAVKLNQLKQITERSRYLLKAAEDWEKGYKDDPESFDMLLKMEIRLENKMRQYFRELANDRVAGFVNWQNYSVELLNVHRAFEVFVDVIDDAFEGEYYILLNILIDEVAAGMRSGYTAQQNATRFFLPPTRIENLIDKAARKYSVRLAKGLNKTTRQRIASTIAKSLQLGEDVQTTTNRLMRVINDRRRAMTIARTESVNSYGRGTVEFGKQSGAKKKVWKTVQLNACPICAPLDNVAVRLDADFNTAIGPLFSPAAHPNCRCRSVLEY